MCIPTIQAAISAAGSATDANWLTLKANKAVEQHQVAFHDIFLVRRQLKRLTEAIEEVSGVRKEDHAYLFPRVRLASSWKRGSKTLRASCGREKWRCRTSTWLRRGTMTTCTPAMTSMIPCLRCSGTDHGCNPLTSCKCTFYSN